jgi:hypothetical protein
MATSASPIARFHFVVVDAVQYVSVLFDLKWFPVPGFVLAGVQVQLGGQSTNVHEIDRA